MNKPPALLNRTRGELEDMLRPGKCHISQEHIRQTVKWAIHKEIEERALTGDLPQGDGIAGALEAAKEAQAEAEGAFSGLEDEREAYRERFAKIGKRIVKGRDIRIAALDARFKQDQATVKQAEEALRTVYAKLSAAEATIESLRELIRVGDEL